MYVLNVAAKVKKFMIARMIVNSVMAMKFVIAVINAHMNVRGMFDYKK